MKKLAIIAGGTEPRWTTAAGNGILAIVDTLGVMKTFGVSGFRSRANEAGSSMNVYGSSWRTVSNVVGKRGSYHGWCTSHTITFGTLFDVRVTIDGVIFEEEQYTVNNGQLFKICNSEKYEETSWYNHVLASSHKNHSLGLGEPFNDSLKIEIKCSAPFTGNDLYEWAHGFYYAENKFQ